MQRACSSRVKDLLAALFDFHIDFALFVLLFDAFALAYVIPLEADFRKSCSKREKETSKKHTRHAQDMKQSLHRDQRSRE